MIFLIGSDGTEDNPIAGLEDEIIRMGSRVVPNCGQNAEFRLRPPSGRTIN